MTADTHLCPRRAELPDTFRLPPRDTWDTDRWAHEKAEWPTELTEPPRTCSFCGGIHIDDAITLLEHGWEISPTTKGYKWYIEPPGYTMWHRRLVASIGNDKKMDAAYGAPHHTVAPPIKLYGQHASQEQVDRLNQLLQQQRFGVEREN